MTPRQRRRPDHDLQMQRLALIGGLPAVAIALVLLWTGAFTPKVQWTLTLVVVAFWWGFSLALRERVVRPLQTLSNLIAALREGDYSIRARGGRLDDALGQAMHEINALREPLRNQRHGALEAIALLQKVMEEIDVAIFAFDEDGTLRLVNRAGERLVGQPSERMIGRPASELGLQAFLEGEPRRVVDAFLPGGERARPQGRVEIRRSTFRQSGLPHQLIVVSDLTRALRDEERQAWQRLVRVLGHEINNSLAPIRSIVGSLQDLIRRSPRPDDWLNDLERGLGVIGSRSDALARFMTSYTRLARLPRPRHGTVDVSDWVHRAAELEKRTRVEVREGPSLRIQADGDQLDQLLINLVGNAVDAALETQGAVRVEWQRAGDTLELRVLDDGPGIAHSANLFVPFYTTKIDGTGIGLALSRQIAEAHGGTLTLRNRTDARGAEARLLLPIAAPTVPPLGSRIPQPDITRV
jgi:two-component system, NtrC family, nitrogen regulation sensor histidine kinase NtrY